MADFDPSADAIVAEIAAAPSPEALEEIRVRVLGRRGSLTLAMRELGGLEPEERRRAGAALNAAKDRITAALGEAAARLGRAALEQRLAAARADPTLPVPFATAGRLHPISQTVDEIVAIFGEMGRPSTRRGRSTTPFICRSGRTAPGSCCAPTPRPSRSARCWRRNRRSAS
jgi:phenylalanyl-tRNA synthetase alpha chain